MSTSVRAKRQLAIYGGVLGVVLIVAGVASMGGAYYVYSNPPVEEIPPDEFDVQEFETDVEHSAVVTRPTPLYDQGESLENMPVYFTNATPELQLSVVTSVPDDRDVMVGYRLVIHYEATFEDVVYWERQQVLVGDEAVVSDGTHYANTTLDVEETIEFVDEIESGTAGIGSFSTELRVETTYDTTAADDGTYEGELSATAPLELGDDAYWIDDDLSDAVTESQTGEGETRELPPDMSVVYGLGVLGIVLILAGVGIATWKTRADDVSVMEAELIRSRYDEWISNGEFPAGSENQYIYINSLEDLVDVAIDTNKRVIYDPDLETYSVVDDDLVYYHAADPTQIESWVGLSGDGN